MEYIIGAGALKIFFGEIINESLEVEEYELKRGGRQASLWIGFGTNEWGRGNKEKRECKKLIIV